MALTANTIFDVRTTGSDTLNGGAFDPSQTAGMFTDGAATSATGNSPVFSSASYNFVASDVNAWLYIAAGTNWTPGWYQIASVAANAATLSAAIGASMQTTTGGVNTRFPDHASTVAGCATTASPTGATWSIDYSQQDAAQFAYTDLMSAGTGLTVSSVAKPFAKQQVGNSIAITGGTNFNTGRYVIASVAASVATVLGPTNITTGVGAAGTGGQGGCVKTPGIIGGLIGGGVMFVISGVTHTISSATINVANGVVSNVSSGLWVGWGTSRHIQNTDTPPTLQFTTSAVAMFNDRGAHYNFIIDGNSQTTSAYANASSNGVFDRCQFKNLTAAASVSIFCTRCLATGCSAAQFAGIALYCEAYANTATPFTGAAAHCQSYANTGASTDGFSIPAISYSASDNCTAYNNGRDGFRFATSGRGQSLINCHSEGNAGYGYNPNTSLPTLIGCSDFNNTSGRVNLVAGTVTQQIGAITLTGSAFTNAAGNDLSLNNTAGAGAAIRGISQAFPRGTTTGFFDNGAVQHQDSGGISTLMPQQWSG